MVSTFLTMVFVPVLYSLFEDGHRTIERLFKRLAPAAAETA
jgi:hypothetical protein